MAGLGHHYKLAACPNCQCLGTASNSPFIEQNRTVDDGAAAALAAIENTIQSLSIHYRSYTCVRVTIHGNGERTGASTALYIPAAVS